jgi:hypothetical protein
MNRACRVLFIAKSFPPEGGSSVQRTAKFVKYLPHFRVEPRVLTVDAFTPLRDGSLLGEIPSSVRVFRAFSPEPGHLKVRLTEYLHERGSKGLPLRALLKLYALLYYRSAMVDWSIGWVPFAVRRGMEIIRSEKVDVIYAHTPPPTSLLVGQALKKKSGLPLIIDYADPCTGKPILGIVPPGPEAEILQKSRVGFIAAPNDFGSVRATLLQMLDVLRVKGPVAGPDWDFIRSFDRRRLVAHLASEVHGLVRRGHNRRREAEACTPI